MARAAKFPVPSTETKSPMNDGTQDKHRKHNPHRPAIGLLLWMYLTALVVLCGEKHGARIDEVVEPERNAADIEQTAYQIDGIEVRRIAKHRALGLRGRIDVTGLDDLAGDPPVACAHPVRTARC